MPVTLNPGLTSLFEVKAGFPNSRPPRHPPLTGSDFQNGRTTSSSNIISTRHEPIGTTQGELAADAQAHPTGTEAPRSTTAVTEST